jgi:hypothetical protein
MANWMVLRAEELQFEEVSGVDVHEGVIRYVMQRHEDGSFGSIDVGGRNIRPTSSIVYVHGNTVHVQVG